jgi:hypothetical protein
LGEELLRLDGFPVLDAAEVADDHHLMEATHLLVQPPDLRDDVIRRPQETQLFFNALIIGESAEALRDAAGVEAIAGGVQFLGVGRQRVDRRGVEVQEIRTYRSASLLTCRASSSRYTRRMKLISGV